VTAPNTAGLRLFSSAKVAPAEPARSGRFPAYQQKSSGKKWLIIGGLAIGGYLYYRSKKAKAKKEQERLSQAKAAEDEAAVAAAVAAAAVKPAESTEKAAPAPPKPLGVTAAPFATPSTQSAKSAVPTSESVSTHDLPVSLY
jgi:hypothetical protein